MKERLYQSIIINHVFLGLKQIAVETLGPFSDGARRFVDEFGKLLVDASDDARSKAGTKR